MSRLAKKIADVRFLRLTLWNRRLVSAGKRAHDLYALAWDVGETNNEESEFQYGEKTR
jgi:hypothetical protein